MTFFMIILLGFIALGVANALYQMRNHPKGLYILFFAEMWERFSYYGMRALLIFYLTKHFLFTDDQAYGIYGAYTTLVYITPVIGGMLADRYLGQRKAILIGAILLVLGHGGMAIEGAPVTDPAFRDATVLNIFYLSLALIIAGTGFLKANISAIVGELYEKTDPRRDGAFTLFYVGINLGAAGGALIAGGIGETFGWAYGFGLAGIGMLAGLIVFVWGKPLLQGAGEPPNPAYLAEKVGGILSREWLIYILSFLGVGLIWYLVRDEGTVGTTLLIAMVLTYGYILYRSVFQLEPHARNRILAALFLITVQVLFWALFEQAGSSLNIFTDRAVDRTILGQEQPASIFQSLNAIYIVFLGPLFAMGWAWLAKRNLDPSTGAKFGLGVIQLGLGFLVLVWGAQAAGLGNLTPVFFICMIYLLHTTGELCLSPVGLSAMTRLSTPNMVGLIMGAWFLASGAGNFVAAQIAKLTSSDALADLDAEAALAETQRTVLEVYSQIGWIAVGVGVALIAVSPIIKRMMHLDTLEDDMARYHAKHGTADLTMDGDGMAGERMSPTGEVKE
ncbi:MAG: peptide MFS transporter [Litorimonas sp.]